MLPSDSFEPDYILKILDYYGAIPREVTKGRRGPVAKYEASIGARRAIIN